jgi:NTP pyrophosphatase (non-canonical NTP hydrolase)
MHLSELARRNWAWVEGQGWHNKSPLECLMLIVSECGEAANECRNEHPTDHFSEELADIILRTIDLAEDNGIDIEAAVLRKIAINDDFNLKTGYFNLKLECVRLCVHLKNLTQTAYTTKNLLHVTSLLHKLANKINLVTCNVTNAKKETICVRVCARARVCAHMYIYIIYCYIYLFIGAICWNH